MITNEYRVVGFERVNENIFAFAKGRKFDLWFTGRPNYNVGEVVRNPAYVIESILRDECFVERDLKVTVIQDTDKIECDGLLFNTPNYYDNAILHDITANKSYLIKASSGLRNIILFEEYTGQVGNNLIITNINGSKVVTSTFDDAHNKRSAWVFDRSITEQDKAEVYINQALYESQSILDRSQGKYRLIALEKDETSTTVFDKYLKQSGNPKVELSFTPLSDLYTSFRLLYNYDYGKGDYVRSLYVDYKGGQSDLRDLCRSAERNYKAKQLFTYEAGFIYDKNTATYLLEKLVSKHTKQRAIVDWYAPAEYIKYSVGDQGKLDCPLVLPAQLNNSAQFMITKIEPIIKMGSPEIHIRFEEMF